MDLVLVILLTLLAGLAMPAGGLLARIERIRPGWIENELRHAVIAFGGGVLLAAVGFVLVPKGAEALPWFAAAPALAVGGLAFMGLDIWLDRRGGSAANLVAMLADFLPEAMALGATFTADTRAGVLLAVLIALQNVPEGFNAYRELIASMRKNASEDTGGADEEGSTAGPREKGRAGGKVIAWLFAASLLGPVCGLLGYYVLADHDGVVGAVMLAASGGILYLTFQDIAPQAKLSNRFGPPIGAVLGFLVGMLGHMLLG